MERKIVVEGKMKVIIDESMRKIGITDVVYAVGKGINPFAELTPELATAVETMGADVVAGKYDSIYDNAVTLGYKDLVASVGRSVKKNPPTVPGFLDNIKHRGSMPHINSIVDVYNIESIRSSLAIGGHDFDSVHGDVIFKVCGDADTFTAIGGSVKQVAATDFVYRDDNGILAWLDVRDSEFYKMSDSTKNVFFVMQGNKETSVEYRVSAMKRIEADLRLINPDMEFEIGVASI